MPGDHQGVLVWEGANIEEIAQSIPTPFFLVSEAALLRNAAVVRDALGAAGVPVVVRYCAKTNNELGVLRILSSAGYHALVSHPAELELAETAGFSPERIAYQRPVLDGPELSTVLARDPTLFHLYRESDIEQLEAAARVRGRPIAVSIRLRKHAVIPSPLTILSARLGIAENDAPRIAKRISRSDALSLGGLNFYIGTQQRSVDGYRSMLRTAGRILETLERDGISVPEVNLGGGIPSPSLHRPGPMGLLARWNDAPSEPEPLNGLDDFCRRLARQFAEHVLTRVRGERPSMAIEPGRAIVGNAVILVARVVAIQGSWLFLDCSRNSLGESPLLFHRRVRPVQRSGGQERFWNLSGNTLNTLDVIDLHRRLPSPEKGDLIALFDAGAYSISRATRYAGLAPAVHLLGKNGAISCIRQQESGADLAARMTSGTRSG